MKFSQSTVILALLPLASQARLAAPKSRHLEADHEPVLIPPAFEGDGSESRHLEADHEPVLIPPAYEGDSKKRHLQTCQDKTVNGLPWHDSRGAEYTCAWYETEGFGEEKNCKKYGKNKKYTNYDMLAIDACCVCDGGEWGTVPTASPTPSPTPHPTDAGTSGPPPTLSPTPQPTDAGTSGSTQGYDGLCPDQTEAGLSYEQQVLDLVNQYRASGVTCSGTGEYMPPVPPLQMHQPFRCTSRYHSQWITEENNGRLSHSSPGGALGDTLRERLESSGYYGGNRGEIIAGAYSPQSAVNTWLNSNSIHCKIMMSAWSTDAGVGWWSGPEGSSNSKWTMVFGTNA